MSDSDNDNDLLVLHGKRYWKQGRWSRDKKINIRTTARHRQLGLPWLAWGGEVYIPEPEGDAYIVSRVRRRNPPRRRRQAITAEIGAARPCAPSPPPPHKKTPAAPSRAPGPKVLSGL